MVVETFEDPLLRALLVAWIVDFLLGVLAAFKLGAFDPGMLARTLRDDAVVKIVPVVVLVAGAQAGGELLPDVPLSALAYSAASLALVGFVASIRSSLTELGVSGPLKGVEDRS